MKSFASEELSKPRPRDLNMELLRIVSMFFVIATHSNFSAIGEPTQADTLVAPIGSSIRFFLEAALIVCADVFVLISGWYGMRFRLERFAAFLFQLFFFALSGFLVAALLMPETALTRNGVGSVFLLSVSDYWFAKIYLLLYLAAPLLNFLIERTSPRLLRRLLWMSFGVIMVYGWLYPDSGFHLSGTSPLFFMWLYVLGRHLRLHCSPLCRFSARVYFFIYVASSLVVSVIEWLGTRGSLHTASCYDLNSPLFILSAVALLLFFSRLSVSGRWISWVASSCFAVYLLHVHRLLFEPIFLAQVRDWWERQPVAVFLAFTVVWMLIFFFAAILLDKIRIWIWSKLKLFVFTERDTMVK